MPPLILMSLLMVFTNTTHAAVYKCQTANDQIVYTDTPCEAGNKEIAMEVISPSAQGIDTASKASIMRQLDAAVKSAIAANEMTRAGALATTTEHKEWIAAAMKENARQTFKSPAELREEKASSAECAAAKRKLEAETDARFSDPAVLNAKKSLMYAACGILEPVIVEQAPQSTMLYNFPYHHRFMDRNWQHPHYPDWRHPDGFHKRSVNRPREAPAKPEPPKESKHTIQLKQ